ncbi:hypothetical protein Tco_1236468 [Tanacetum coccineum]
MGKPQQDDTGFVDSGCSRHMTGNITYLLDFKEFDGGYVAFGGGSHGGRITGKGLVQLVLSISTAKSRSKYPQYSGPPIKVGDEAVHKKLGDRIERAATTASSLEAEPNLVLTVQVNDAEGDSINTSIQFAETHNVVAFLEKPIESDGFAEIIDFLKASSVHYALTVNPIIYISYIEQFWATTKVKTVNGVRQIQALIDKKKLIITETSIRTDLHLEDAGGTYCFPTTTIFEKLEDDKETDEHEEVKADDTTELKKHLVIKKDDDIAIDVIPLATKPPVIGIDKEDLQTLWKLVKTKHGDLRPEDEHERVL